MLPTSRTLLILTSLLLATVPLGAQGFPTTKIAKMDAAFSLQSLPNNHVVPLNIIAGDFAKNQEAALGKYNGQRITVIGRISALSQGSSENKVLVVTLQDPSANLPAVRGDFLFGSIPLNSEIQVAADSSMATIVHRDGSGNILSQQPYLAVDQRVGLKGNFKELKAGDIVLTDCKLISKQQLHQLESK